MNRTDVIQSIIDKTDACSYLEIGVADGSNFHPIRARDKTAVDPAFGFRARNRIRWSIKNRCNIRAKYHEQPSDEYFKRIRPSQKFDVVFIDGLHTYQQSLRDVVNALNCLSQAGVIIMHDCNPANAAEACPAENLEQAGKLNVPGWNGEWCGDVWKTICHLRSREPNLQVFVLDCDRGLGIVTRGNTEGLLNLTKDEIAALTYEDLANDRKNLLNLKDESCFPEFLERLHPGKTSH